MEITQPLHRALQLTPEREHTIAGDRVRTVRETVDRVARLAGALAGLGISKDDRVAVVSLNSDIYHEALLAIPWADGVVVPVNYRWSPAEIAHSFAECDVAVAIVDDTYRDLLAAVLASAPGSITVIHAGSMPTPDGMLQYEDLIADAQPVPDARRGGGDIFGIFYTGGTTGVPKGVVLSHDNMMTSAYGCVASGEFLTPDGRLLHVAPMFHLADLCTWLGGLILGSTHVFVPAFTPAAVLGAIAEHGGTDILVVPTMLQMLIDLPDAARYDVRSMRHIVYGASPISESVLDRAAAFFPHATFLQAYGMSELSPVATLLLSEDHQHPARRVSAGRAARHVELRIVDENDVEVGRGTVGEITVRGGATMIGYWNRPEETAEALRGGWMHTGDGGYMDEDGYVYVVDRIKDMIITGGENVYSIEVEKVVAKHPAVAACAVIGVPDEQWGERVHAVIVLHPEASVTLDEIRSLGRDHIAGYKLPRSVSFVDSLPLSAQGKVLKRELRLTAAQPAGV